MALAVDSSGNVFIGDSWWRVRRIDAATGIIDTFAGNGEGGFSGDGGPATGAGLSWVADLAVAADGSLLIADSWNGRVRRVDVNGIITTFAGNGDWATSGDDGPALLAGLGSVAGIAVDGDGVLLFNMSEMTVRRIDASGVIRRFAGTGAWDFGGDGGPALDALLTVLDIGADGAGNVYIADSASNRIRRVDHGTGIITTVAGNGTNGASGDGYPGPQGSFAGLSGVATVPDGSIVVSDVSASSARRIAAGSRVLSTVAGTGEAGFAGDGGTATDALLRFPQGVASDTAGNTYIVDTLNSRIRKVNALTGIINTVAGGGVWGDGVFATGAALSEPMDVAVDPGGNMFIADRGHHRVRRVDAVTGIITTVAGTGVAGFTGDGGPATAARLYCPDSLALDAAGGCSSWTNATIASGGSTRTASSPPLRATGRRTTPATARLRLIQDSLRHLAWRSRRPARSCSSRSIHFA
jgi:sugar lactone lactonase YvrE